MTSVFDKMPEISSGKIKLRSGSPQPVDNTGRYELAASLIEEKDHQALRYLELAAGEKHGASLNLLGLLYATGQIVEKDPHRAFKYFKKAAELGNPDAEYYFAMALREGFGCRPDYVKSFAWLRLAAKAHHAEAIFAAAKSLEEGLGVKADKETAEKYFEQAALEGQHEALKRAIKKAIDSDPIDFEKLRFWTKIASAEDIPEAMLAFARQMLEESSSNALQAVALLERAVSLDFAPAMGELAFIWHEGDFTDKDLVQAIVYAHMAASSGLRAAEKWVEAWREEATEEELEEVIDIVSLPNRKEMIIQMRQRQKF